MQVYFVLDERGQPVPESDVNAWARWFEQADRGVARTVVTPEVFVLTTFSGCDDTDNASAARLFESRVFGGPLDGELTQYVTRAEALAGHARLVEWCRIGASPDAGITEDQIA